LALQYHPDRNPEKPAAKKDELKKKFQQLSNEFSKINVTVKNLTKLLYFSDEFLKRKVKK
jgi:curved DNA-binding protein CbpA